MVKEIRKTQHLGESLAVTIPPTVRDILGIKRGDYLSIDIENNKMTVEPVHPSVKMCEQASHSQPIKDGAAND